MQINLHRRHNPKFIAEAIAQIELWVGTSSIAETIGQIELWFWTSSV